MNTAAAAGQSRHHHAVQFYGTDESLFTTVAGFLAEGLAAHQSAIIIATPPHRRGIVEHLCGRSIDCKKATHDGDLMLLDAEKRSTCSWPMALLTRCSSPTMSGG